MCNCPSRIKLSRCNHNWNTCSHTGWSHFSLKDEIVPCYICDIGRSTHLVSTSISDVGYLTFLVILRLITLLKIILLHWILVLNFWHKGFWDPWDLCSDKCPILWDEWSPLRMVTTRWLVSLDTLHLCGRERDWGLETDLIINSQWYNQTWLPNKSLQEILTTSVGDWSIFYFINTSICHKDSTHKYHKDQSSSA